MKKAPFIEVTSNRLPIRLFVQDILWMHVCQNAMLIHTDAGIVKTYMTYTRMKALVEQNFNCFLTCYKGCLVNMDRISRIDGLDFILENGERVQMRKRDAGQICRSWTRYQYAKSVNTA